MKKIIMAITALLSLTVSAQNPVVTVTDSVTGDNSVVLIARTTGYGNFTIRLNISEISNCSTDITELPEVYTVKGNSNTQLVVLHPADTTRPVEIRYGWDWVQGRMDSAVDPGFIYRLPVGNHRKVTAREVFAQEAGLARSNALNFKMWELTAPQNESVYAMRKGEVIRTEGNLIIEHSDGTQAVYGGLEGITVTAGDMVYPDTVLGTSGANGITIAIYGYGSNSRTHVYPQVLSQQEYIDPLFLTTKGVKRLTDGSSVKARVTKNLLTNECK